MLCVADGQCTTSEHIKMNPHRLFLQQLAWKGFGQGSRAIPQSHHALVACGPNIIGMSMISSFSEDLACRVL